MSEPKFTQGPWRAIINTNGKYFPSVQIGPKLRYPDNSGVGNHRITVNEGQPRGEKHWSNTMEACNANAKLIAASPLLYEALVDCLSELEFWHSKYPKTNGNSNLKAAKSAIAAAGGD
jgi:hypothetical protein